MKLLHTGVIVMIMCGHSFNNFNVAMSWVMYTRRISKPCSNIIHISLC